MELMEARRPASGHADRILKVNHAGEHGAVNIYAGQRLVARFTARRMLGELAEFHAHERKHRGIFQVDSERREGAEVRRCRRLSAVRSRGGLHTGRYHCAFGQSRHCRDYGRGGAPSKTDRNAAIIKATDQYCVEGVD